MCSIFFENLNLSQTDKNIKILLKIHKRNVILLDNIFILLYEIQAMALLYEGQKVSQRHEMYSRELAFCSSLKEP